MASVQDFNGAGDHAQPGVAEQRRSWREPVVASGVLTARGVDGAAGQRAVRVVNLSDGGVGLIAATVLGVGNEYALEIAGRPERSGTVRVVFCRPNPRGGFEVGAAYVPADQG